MIKYIPFLAIALCACAHTAPVAAVTPADAPPVTVELSNKLEAQAVACADGLDCLKKLTGLCHNGYVGGRQLAGENQRPVGILFHCITDAEKAEREAAEAEEKAEEQRFEEMRAAKIQQMIQQAQKAQKK